LFYSLKIYSIPLRQGLHTRFMKTWNKIYSYFIKLNNQSCWRQKQRVALAAAFPHQCQESESTILHIFGAAHKYAEVCTLISVQIYAHVSLCIISSAYIRTGFSECKFYVQTNWVHVSGNTQKIWNTEENHRFLPFSCSRDSGRKKYFRQQLRIFLMPFHHLAQFEFKLSGVTQKLLVKRQG